MLVLSNAVCLCVWLRCLFVCLFDCLFVCLFPCLFGWLIDLMAIQCYLPFLGCIFYQRLDIKVRKDLFLHVRACVATKPEPLRKEMPSWPSVLLPINGSIMPNV